MSNVDPVKTYLLTLQNRICAELEQLDGRARLVEDPTRLANECLEQSEFAASQIDWTTVHGGPMPTAVTPSTIACTRR